MLGGMRVRWIAAAVVVWTLSGFVACGGEAPPASRVYASAEDVQPLAAGQRVPSVSVVAVDGKAVDLAEVVRDRGALLVFYRGGW
jgi:hypothetical protein